MNKIVALLTARGNNTMKDKNVRIVAGHPLLYYPAMAAKKSRYIHKFYVSSDDEKILNEASKCGYVKIKRPDELALPTAQHQDAITHALKVMKSSYVDEPDILIVMLGNSATVKTKWINDCIEEILKNDQLSAVVPVLQDSDHHPYRAKKINKNGLLEPFFDFSNMTVSTNRQDLEQSYFLCHNFWVLNLKNTTFCNKIKGQAPWRFMGNFVKPYVVEGSFDVHDEEDIVKTENWLNLNKDEFNEI